LNPVVGWVEDRQRRCAGTAACGRRLTQGPRVVAGWGCCGRRARRGRGGRRWRGAHHELDPWAATLRPARIVVHARAGSRVQREAVVSVAGDHVRHVERHDLPDLDEAGRSEHRRAECRTRVPSDARFLPVAVRQVETSSPDPPRERHICRHREEEASAGHLPAVHTAHADLDERVLEGVGVDRQDRARCEVPIRPRLVDIRVVCNDSDRARRSPWFSAGCLCRAGLTPFDLAAAEELATAGAPVLPASHACPDCVLAGLAALLHGPRGDARRQERDCNHGECDAEAAEPGEFHAVHQDRLNGCFRAA